MSIKVQTTVPPAHPLLRAPHTPYPPLLTLHEYQGRNYCTSCSLSFVLRKVHTHPPPSFSLCRSSKATDHFVLNLFMVLTLPFSLCRNSNVKNTSRSPSCPISSKKLLALLFSLYMSIKIQATSYCTHPLQPPHTHHSFPSDSAQHQGADHLLLFVLSSDLLILLSSSPSHPA
jgi:hypothetical protein